MHEVVLSNGKISTISIDAKIGDIVRIIHTDDDGLHALYLDHEHHSFDLTDMKRGDHYNLEITNAGVYEVGCHIMDSMTLVINVAAAD